MKSTLLLLCHPAPQLVSGLEQAMIAAECEISFLYNSEDQARLWKCREEGCFR